MACGTDKSSSQTSNPEELELIPGANQLGRYLPSLKGKTVGLVANHTSMVGNTHLADTLHNLGIKIKAIFAPEHGFRGSADAGEQILDGKDKRTGIPVISIYGKNKKPQDSQLEGIDVLVYDIQDVGARFYTYLSTLHYIMEAAAEKNIKVIVLDRPNPNGHYFDGPVLDTAFKSFVGMHSIPVVHGNTLGEMAKMINGEGWLKNGVKCNLEVVTVSNYTHQTPYSLPIKPSPNLPSDRSIELYPSLCFFEGTLVSVGRGTAIPFELIGSPKLDTIQTSHLADFVRFTPVSTEGAKYPPYENKQCFGFDLSKGDAAFSAEKGLNLDFLIKMFEWHGGSEDFFSSPSFFDKLAGSDKLRKQLLAGKTEKEIRQSWQADLEEYAKLREKYLLYPLN
jgi:uncharacterized protein YbbC (DUF1343 family)